MTVLTKLLSAASFAAAKLGQKGSVRWTGKQGLNNLMEFPFASTFLSEAGGLVVRVRMEKCTADVTVDGIKAANKIGTTDCMYESADK